MNITSNQSWEELPLKKVEGVINGTIDYLRPILFKFTEDFGFGWQISDKKQEHNYGPVFHVFSLGARIDGGNATLGTIEATQLPRERILLTFRPNELYQTWEATDPELAMVKEAFERFINEFFLRLAALGFVEIPEPKQVKPPLGFQPPNKQD